MSETGAKWGLKRPERIGADRSGSYPNGLSTPILLVNMSALDRRGARPRRRIVTQRCSSNANMLIMKAQEEPCHSQGLMFGYLKHYSSHNLPSIQIITKSTSTYFITFEEFILCIIFWKCTAKHCRIADAVFDAHYYANSFQAGLDPSHNLDRIPQRPLRQNSVTVS